jgi:dTDP-4-dehydrorhamnose reductase
MRILVTGRAGQLVTSLAERAAHNGRTELITCGRPEFDLEHPETISRSLEALQPDLVVNAAAYTAVDRAESDAELAFAINRDGAAEMARVANSRGVPLVHISTDYVFDGNKPNPYTELDEPVPLSVYGRSKLEGERAVMAAHPEALVLRTSWLFSPFGCNFVKTMLRVGAERRRLRIVRDQIGNPTSALDLAAAILEIAPVLLRERGGLYHLAGRGSASWHDFAVLIFKESCKRGGPAPQLEAIRTADYKMAAQRPANSRLNCDAFSCRFGITLRSWEDTVVETVSRCLHEPSS